MMHLINAVLCYNWKPQLPADIVFSLLIPLTDTVRCHGDGVQDDIYHPSNSWPELPLTIQLYMYEVATSFPPTDRSRVSEGGIKLMVQNQLNSHLLQRVAAKRWSNALRCKMQVIIILLILVVQESVAFRFTTEPTVPAATTAPPSYPCGVDFDFKKEENGKFSGPW